MPSSACMDNRWQVGKSCYNENVVIRLIICLLPIPGGTVSPNSLMQYWLLFSSTKAFLFLPWHLFSCCVEVTLVLLSTAAEQTVLTIHQPFDEFPLMSSFTH